MLMSQKVENLESRAADKLVGRPGWPGILHVQLWTLGDSVHSYANICIYISEYIIMESSVYFIKQIDVHFLIS